MRAWESVLIVHVSPTAARRSARALLQSARPAPAHASTHAPSETEPPPLLLFRSPRAGASLASRRLHAACRYAIQAAVVSRAWRLRQARGQRQPRQRHAQGRQRAQRAQRARARARVQRRAARQQSQRRRRRLAAPRWRLRRVCIGMRNPTVTLR